MKRIVLKSVLLAVVAGGAVPGTAQQVDWASPRLQQPKMDAFGPYDAEFIAAQASKICKRAMIVEVCSRRILHTGRGCNPSPLSRLPNKSCGLMNSNNRIGLTTGAAKASSRPRIGHLVLTRPNSTGLDPRIDKIVGMRPSKIPVVDV